MEQESVSLNVDGLKSISLKKQTERNRKAKKLSKFGALDSPFAKPVRTKQQEKYKILHCDVNIHSPQTQIKNKQAPRPQTSLPDKRVLLSSDQQPAQNSSLQNRSSSADSKVRTKTDKRIKMSTSTLLNPSLHENTSTPKSILYDKRNLRQLKLPGKNETKNDIVYSECSNTSPYSRPFSPSRKLPNMDTFSARQGYLMIYTMNDSFNQPIGFVAYDESTTLCHLRKKIIEKLNRVEHDFLFISQMGKFIGKKAETRIRAQWFYPSISIKDLVGIGTGAHNGKDMKKKRKVQLYRKSNLTEALIKKPASKHIREVRERQFLISLLEKSNGVDNTISKLSQGHTLELARTKCSEVMAFEEYNTQQRDAFDLFCHYSTRDKEKNDAAVRIQSIHRRNTAIKSLYKRQAEQAALTIQSSQRKLMEQMKVNNTPMTRDYVNGQSTKRHNSTCSIAGDKNNLYESAVISIQKTYRGFADKERVKNIQKQQNSVIKIQAIHRKNMANERVYKLRQIEYAKINEHQQMLAQKLRDQSASKIQSTHRNYVASKHMKLSRQHEANQHSCAIKIQSLQRKKLAQRKVEKKKKENASAIKIQAIYRKKQAIAVVETKKVEIELNASTIKIQSLHRKNMAKKRVAHERKERMRQGNISAKKIQSQFRRYSSQKQFKYKRSSVIKIQTKQRQNKATLVTEQIRCEKSNACQYSYQSRCTSSNFMSRLWTNGFHFSISCHWDCDKDTFNFCWFITAPYEKSYSLSVSRNECIVYKIFPPSSHSITLNDIQIFSQQFCQGIKMVEQHVLVIELLNRQRTFYAPCEQPSTKSKSKEKKHKGTNYHSMIERTIMASALFDNIDALLLNSTKLEFDSNQCFLIYQCVRRTDKGIVTLVFFENSKKFFLECNFKASNFSICCSLYYADWSFFGIGTFGCSSFDEKRSIAQNLSTIISVCRKSIKILIKKKLYSFGKRFQLGLGILSVYLLNEKIQLQCYFPSRNVCLSGYVNISQLNYLGYESLDKIDDETRLIACKHLSSLVIIEKETIYINI